jgi:hypothetical protein
MNYNPHSTAFTSKQEMQGTSGCVASSVANDCMLAIEAARSMTLSPIKYVRTGALPSTEDLHLYDLGKVYVATMGCPTASANVGELYISYDITYYKPVTKIGSEVDGMYCYFNGTISDSWITGTSTPTYVYNNLGCSVPPAVNYIQVDFPAGTAGEYMITCSFTASANRNIASNTMTRGNCVAQTLPATSSVVVSTYFGPELAVNWQACTMVTYISITNPSAASWVRFAPSWTTGGAMTSGTLMVTELPAPLTVTTQAFLPRGVRHTEVVEEVDEEDHGGAAAAAAAPPPATKPETGLFRRR